VEHIGNWTEKKEGKNFGTTDGLGKEAQKDTATGKDGGLGKGSKEVLYEIVREKRERKATKADGAAVPNTCGRSTCLRIAPPRGSWKKGHD
jgi:hypothetical protein